MSEDPTTYGIPTEERGERRVYIGIGAIGDLSIGNGKSVQVVIVTKDRVEMIKAFDALGWAIRRDKCKPVEVHDGGHAPATDESPDWSDPRIVAALRLPIAVDQLSHIARAWPTSVMQQIGDYVLLLKTNSDDDL